MLFAHTEGVDCLIDSGLSTAGHCSLKGDVRVGVDWVNVGAFASQSNENVSEHCIRVVRDWEHEASDNPMSVKGKLAKQVKFWSEVIQAPAYILDVVRSGYVLPFCTEPPEFSQANQTSAIGNFSFVNQAISELLSDG